MDRKIKVFFLTFDPPTPTLGGAMAFYRHFFERDDFEVFVATDNRRVLQYELPCQVLLFDQPRWLERLTRTRFSLWAHSFRHLLAGYFIPKEVLRAAQDFQPDLIFTIAGSWGWTTLMARQLAHRLDVPLVGSFNDWFDFSIFIHPWFRPLLEKTFRAFYRDCDLAFCTSDGMKKELGFHRNAHVLYPIGSRPRTTQVSLCAPKASTAPFVVAYAGNLGQWYGPMLERLVTSSLKSESRIQFHIYGAYQSWSDKFDHLTRGKNIYRGLLNFEQLIEELKEADALLLPMGFGEDCALTERTSFKTKFLDYVTHQKPIFVWGPEYCTAVQVAREFESAEICNSPDAEEALRCLITFSDQHDRQMLLIRNASLMFLDRFHPNKIHTVFLNEINNIINQSNKLIN